MELFIRNKIWTERSKQLIIKFSDAEREETNERNSLQIYAHRRF